MGNITNGGKYSGATTATLLTDVISSMNNNKYRVTVKILSLLVKDIRLRSISQDFQVLIKMELLTLLT